MIWRVTPAEKRALAALSREVPRHWHDLTPHMRWPTMRRLLTATPERPSLVDDVTLKPAWGHNLDGWTFYRLTDAGAAARRAMFAR